MKNDEQTNPVEGIHGKWLSKNHSRWQTQCDQKFDIKIPNLCWHRYLWVKTTTILSF